MRQVVLCRTPKGVCLLWMYEYEMTKNITEKKVKQDKRGGMGRVGAISTAALTNGTGK